MNTYLFQNTNDVVLTEATCGIIEKSNSIDSLRIIVPKIYNDTFNMAEFNGLLEFRTPITHTNGIVELVLTDDNYKEDYLLYTLSNTYITTALTAEQGDVEFLLYFMKAEVMEDGSVVERVRTSSAPAFLKVLPLSSWFTPSESALSTLAQLYLDNQRLAEALQASADIIATQRADNMVIDDENETLALTASGIQIGDPITLKELNQKLVLIGGRTPDNGNVSIQEI